MNIVQLVGCQFPAIFWCNIIIYQLCVHFFSRSKSYKCRKIKIILRIFRWVVGIQLHIQKKKLRSSRTFLSQNTKNRKFNDSMKSSIHLNCLYVHMKIFRWKNNINVFFFSFCIRNQHTLIDNFDYTIRVCSWQKSCEHEIGRSCARSRKSQRFWRLEN